MRRRVRRQLEHAPAEIDLGPPLHQPRRRHDDRPRGEISQRLLQAPGIVGFAPCQRRRQGAVADDLGLFRQERGRAEDMIGMHVALDEVADRQVGVPPDGFPQSLAPEPAAAAVDHRDLLAADDEADIGDGAEIGRGHFGVNALRDKEPGRDLGDRRAVGRAAARPGRGAPEDSTATRRRARRTAPAATVRGDGRQARARLRILCSFSPRTTRHRRQRLECIERAN